MGGRRRMDGEAARIADIGDVVEELEGVDEAPSGFLAARELEAQEPAQATLHVSLGPALLLAGPKARMDDAGDPGLLLQPVDHGPGVARMLADAQREGLQPLQEEEGV